MHFFNTPTSVTEFLVMLLGFVPLLTMYEALQEWIFCKLSTFSNLSTATVLGGKEESHENTLSPTGELQPKTRMKTKDLVDASGNVVAEIQVQVPAKTKMGIAGMQFFVFHALFQTFFPWYIFAVIAAKIILGSIIIPEIREKWNWITIKINYYRSANFIIDQLNKLPLATPIKKTYSSLTTYPLFILGPFVLVIFWSFKKLYLNKQNPNIPHSGKDTRGQAALNLGVMVLAFIGYSDFGLWKKFQDWIKFSAYATKVFGDAATEKTCINYNPSLFNTRCIGVAKGPHACIVCAAERLTKEPQINAVITRKYDTRSIMDDPAPYFYELVRHLLEHNNSVPDWYLSLRSDVQHQIFKSHYHSVFERIGKAVPKNQQLTHEKVIQGEFSFDRDERIGKWVVLGTKELPAKHVYQSGPSVLHVEKPEWVPSAQQQSNLYKEQFPDSADYESSDSDTSDYGFTTLDAQYARHRSKLQEKAEEKANQAHAGDEKDEKDPAFPLFDHPPPPVINVTADCIRCGIKVSYPVDGFGYCAKCGLRAPPKQIKTPLFHAEAFEFAEKESSFSLKEHFPFLAILPHRIIKPTIFLTAMCLVLYGSYYYYRKRSTDKVNAELQKEVINQTAQKIIEQQEKFQEVPPVLKDIAISESNEPEGAKGGVSRHRGGQRHKPRHEKKEHVHRPQEDSSDVVMHRDNQTQYKRLKDAKKYNFIVYDIDKLDLVLANKGVVFLDNEDNVHIAKTMEDFKLYINRGYQYIPDNEFKAGTLDVSNMSDEHDSTVKMTPFSKVVSHHPLTAGEWRFINELLQQEAVIPDVQFKRHMTAIDGTHHYKYDEQQKMYVWKPSLATPRNISESRKILNREDKQDEKEIKPLEGIPPLVIRQEEYEKHKQIINDLNFIQANEILEKVRQKRLESLVIAQPESNISTIVSDDCPYGLKCTTEKCVRKHPERNQPEAMCGHVNVPHYPDNLNTNFVFPIFKTSNLDKKHGTCFLTPLGFISLKHVFKNDSLTEFVVKINNEMHPIVELERFPEQKGYNNQLLAQEFQDNVVFKIKDHWQHTSKLNSTRTSIPQAGMAVMVVTASSNGSIRTETSVLREDPSTGLFLIKTNNDYGDSGSAVVNIAKATTIGSYWGTKAKVDNYVIPFEIPHVIALNGNQKFPLTKNSHPSL